MWTWRDAGGAGTALATTTHMTLRTFDRRVHRHDRAIATGLFVAAALAAACSSSSEHDDHVTSPSDAGETSTTDDARDGGDVVVAADAADPAACAPSCSSGQICCTDAHGHFPTCYDGTRCP